MTACERLDAFHDDELAPRSRELLRAHLLGCAACQRELEHRVQLTVAVVRSRRSQEAARS